MNLIDTHNHIDTDIFSTNRQEVVRTARKNGIIAQIVVGFSGDRWQHLLSQCAQENDLYPALGVHPLHLDSRSEDYIQDLQNLIQTKPIIAIGEIGLDFFYKNAEKKQQTLFFEKQLEIAEDRRLPVLLHIRKAHDQVLAILRKRHKPVSGIVHGFSGSMQQAEQFIALGMYLGFGGAITYERARKIRHIASKIPLDHIVLETDAPFMTPSTYHGTPNKPGYLLETARTLAILRNVSIEEIAEKTTENAKKIFML